VTFLGGNVCFWANNKGELVTMSEIMLVFGLKMGLHKIKKGAIGHPVLVGLRGKISVKRLAYRS